MLILGLLEKLLRKNLVVSLPKTTGSGLIVLHKPVSKRANLCSFMCGNINWAKRKKCNECQAPRPGGEAEDRKGRS